MPDRSCTVELTNNSQRFALANPRLFTESGCCEVPLPPSVDPGSAGNNAVFKNDSCCKGAVGVFTYDLYNTQLLISNQVLAVMYSVPYDYDLYSNWFAVGIFEKGITTDYNLYDKMYNGDQDCFVRTKASDSPASYRGNYHSINASMSDTDKALLRVEVIDNGMY